MKEEPKECPFCGCEQVFPEELYTRHWYVECDSCMVRGPLTDTEEEAIEKWNKNTCRDPHDH